MDQGNGYQRRIVDAVEVRATPDGVEGRFEAVVLTYDRLDDYRTMFAPHLFNRSMELRMPRVVWAHDWAEPLGRYVKHRSTRERLSLVGEFDDFDAVPRARQAYAQLQSGTIDQFSIGFLPDPDGYELVAEPGKRGGEKDVVRFTSGRLDEVSLVLVGAVPGTELLSVRNRERIIIPSMRTSMVEMNKAAEVLLDLQSGSIDLADALMALKKAAVDETPTGPATETDPPDPSQEPTEPATVPVIVEPGVTVIEQPGQAEEAESTEAPEPDQDAVDADNALQEEIANALAMIEGAMA